MSAEFDRYLWSGEGHDPEITRLEAALSPLRHRPQEFVLPAQRVVSRRGRRLLYRRVFALASVGFLLLLALSVHRFTWVEGRPWEGELVGPNGIAERVLLVPGASLSTPPESTALLQVARIGSLRVEPESRISLLRTRTGQHRLRLESGRIHARVWAPPRFFGVAVGDVQALDLGCEFSLSRDAQGAGQLEVHSGWVMLSGEFESLVPAGAIASIDPVLGPGTPIRSDASAALRESVAAIDAARGQLDPSGPALARVLGSLTEADGITVLSLLVRYPALADGPLFEHANRMFAHAGPVDRERVRAGSGAALNGWWAALPYPRVKRWWLHWEDAFGHPAH